MELRDFPGSEDEVIEAGGGWKRRLRRGAILAGSAFSLFIGYRALFVYTFSPGACSAPTEVGRPGRRVRPADSAPTGESVRLKVLSYNIGGHAALLRRGHVEAVSRLIEEEQPDLVGLQEVHRETWQARFRDQAAELAERTGMTLYFGPSFRALGGEFGNAVLVRGRVLTGEVLSLPSVGEPRSLLRAEVEVDGLVLDFFVTHLAAWGGLNRRMRTEQAGCLLEHVRTSRRPYVLCGDLNAPAGAPDLEAIVTSDLVRLCGLAEDPTHGLLGRRLDYIFSDPRFEVLQANVLRRGPSDHWPVVAELRWNGG